MPPTGLFWSYLGVASQTRVSRGVMAKADFKTAAVLQWLGDGGDDAWRDERAADPLHCPRIDANLAAILRTRGLPGVARTSQTRFSRAGLSEATRGVFFLLERAKARA